MDDMKKEYKKSFEDELDWNLLEQLHKVVLQISTFCFRTKQICLILEIAVIGLLVKFTESRLDQSIFIAGLVIPLCFWFLDSIAYFYQVKLRAIMENIQERLSERNSEKLIQYEQGFIIEKKRIKRHKAFMLLNALINHSMWLYFMLLSANIILWYLFSKGIIR